MKTLCIILIICSLTYGYRLMEPVSKYIIEAQRKEGASKYDNKTILRHHLHEVVKEAFIDAIHDNDGIDYYSRGMAVSNQSVALVGHRISGDNVTKFCGELAAKKFFDVPNAYRDGVWFKPTKTIPIPVVNITFHLPNRWFRTPNERSPLLYVCYEGDSFLKLMRFQAKPSDWHLDKTFRKTVLFSEYNDRCRIREILLVLDDYWHNRYLLPRMLQSVTTVYSQAILPRITFTEKCDPELGREQPCCLWKFHFNDVTGQRREFHRCFGSLTAESLKNHQIPDTLADLLLAGGLTRRFLNPPTRVCRGIEFKPFWLKTPDGEVKKLDKLDVTKCAAFY